MITDHELIDRQHLTSMFSVEAVDGLTSVEKIPESTDSDIPVKGSPLLKGELGSLALMDGIFILYSYNIVNINSPFISLLIY